MTYSQDSNDENVFKNVSRQTTLEEQALINQIEIEADDLDEFMELLRQGMIQAAQPHKHAVQDNFALRVETTIRLSRPVYNAEDDVVEELIGEEKIQGKLTGIKRYQQDQSTSE
jgi:hypothetical protein